MKGHLFARFPVESAGKPPGGLPSRVLALLHPNPTFFQPSTATGRAPKMARKTRM